jgi:hypothetical protein
MSAVVVALLPNAGLGNKLFVWAKAQLFAHLNNLPLQTVGWTYPKIGPILRGERSTRMYGRLFDTSPGRALLSLGQGYLRSRLIHEPSCTTPAEIDPKAVYLFRKLPHWSNAFGDVRDHRELIRARLQSIVRKECVAELDEAESPVVAIHVRRGDFRVLEPDEDFRQVGGVRTPDAYFAGIVHGLRTAAGFEVPVTVFSDGSDAELSCLLRLPAVARARPLNDISALLLMSRAQVIAISAGSTYGEWAAYLSNAIVLRHPHHIHAPIRPTCPNGRLYEGPSPETNAGWQDLWRHTIAPRLSGEHSALPRGSIPR